MLDLTWLLQYVDVWSVLDILLVAGLFYWLFSLFRGTQAALVLRGVLILVLVTVLLSSFLPLRAFKWLLRNTLPALLLALPVIFQPELRRVLERLGRLGSSLTFVSPDMEVEAFVDTLCEAAARLSERRHGALIVLEREVGLENYMETGIRVDARLSTELLLTIFYPNTALHDGAVIVRGNRVVAAACVLPLTAGSVPDRQMGLRHRAAIGVTEESDAVAIVVSEESGTISIAHNGRIIRRLDGRRLRSILLAFYRPESSAFWPAFWRGVWLRVQHWPVVQRMVRGMRRSKGAS